MERLMRIAIADMIAEDDPISFDLCVRSSEFILAQTKYQPKIGIICGSGLGGIADMVNKPDVIPYQCIPYFVSSSVTGHKSQLVIGTIYNVPVLIMQGRIHFYEGFTLKQCVFPVRVMKMCGVQMIINTAAAGGINPSYHLGDIMILKDHVNLVGMTGTSPLIGRFDERWGPRFLAISDMYQSKWREIAKEVAKSMNIESLIREGVYTMTAGPNYESPAEITFLKMIGVDAVGMSVIHENIIAHHCGIQLFCFSLITNMCIQSVDAKEKASHEEVIATGKSREKDLKEYVSRLVYEFNRYL